MTNLQQLIDRAEIQDLWWRYCRGIDRGDVELIKSVYHEGATDNHGNGLFTGTGQDFAEFIVPLLTGAYVCTQHQLSNMMLEVDGDTARGEVYFSAYHRADNADGTSTIETFGGRYLDKLERRDGRWGIVDRLVVHDWSRHDTSPRYEHIEAFPQGIGSTADASYPHFA